MTALLPNRGKSTTLSSNPSRLQGIMELDRKQMAKAYRLKSDESIKAAEDSLRNDCYRSACNRAWYAIMQIVTAAIYEDLNDTPANNKPNWTHERQSTLFRAFTTKHKSWEHYKSLAPQIDIARERRNDCDYFAPTEKHATIQGATKSVEVAHAVRNAVFTLIGSRWNSHLQTVTTEGEA